MFKCHLIKINDATFESKEYDAFYQGYNDPKNNSWMVFPYRDKESFFVIFKGYVTSSELLCREVFLLVNEQNEYVGICRLTTFKKGPYQGVATINSLAINSNYHRQGYGTKILEALIQYTKDNYPNVNRLELAYEGDNPVAFTGRFYEKNGFKDEGHCYDWFASRAPDFIAGKFPWYTAEYFACYSLKEIEAEFKKEVLALNELTIPPLLESSEYSLQLASSIDIDSLIKLYENSFTSFAHEIPESRRKLIEESIANKNIFIAYEASTNTIVAACEVNLSPAGIEHTVILQNLVTLNNNVAAADFLFKNLIAHFQNEVVQIKRLELNVVPDNEPLVKALEKNNFKCAAVFPVRFIDHQGFYRDEHLYEYSLFGIRDALECCTRRRIAEGNLASKNEKFFLPLPIIFLQQLESQLKNIIENDRLNFSEEQLIYQLVRIICTQDCYTAKSRIAEYVQLHQSHENEFSNSRSLTSVYEMGMKQLKQSLDQELSFWLAESPDQHPNIALHVSEEQTKSLVFN